MSLCEVKSEDDYQPLLIQVEYVWFVAPIGCLVLSEAILFFFFKKNLTTRMGSCLWVVSGSFISLQHGIPLSLQSSSSHAAVYC